MSIKLSSINPERLRWACEDAGISLEELSETPSVKVGLTTFQRLFDGKPSLSFKQLKKVADFFGRGVLFFLEQGVPSAENAHSPQFRAIAGMRPELSPEMRAYLARVEEHRQIYLDLTEADDDRPRFIAPKGIIKQTPKAAAAKARTWLGLELGEGFNEFRERIESKGILVFRSNGYAGKWKIHDSDIEGTGIEGFSLAYQDAPLILVRKRASEGRMAFTLFHELAHLLLHNGSFIDDELMIMGFGHGQEAEADAFAENILMPEELLVGPPTSLIAKPSDLHIWLEKAAKRFGVSRHALILRLRKSGLCPQAAVNRYLAWAAELPPLASGGGNRGFREREPMHILGKPYARAVLSAYQNEEISLAKASAFLDNIDIKRVRLLEDHLVDH